MTDDSRIVRSNSPLWLLAVVVLAVGCSYSLEITHFHVPQFVDLRSTVELECEFHTSVHEKLYSVKWYRPNDRGTWDEFYRFDPGRNPRAKTYNLTGIQVDMKHSNVNRVLLQKVSLNTSGNFKCEVTSKKLHGFGTKLKQGRLEVVALPKKNPKITGGLSNYRIGDRIELICTSDKTYPRTMLKWTLNGKELDRAHTKEYPTRKAPKSGLYRSRLGLDLPVIPDLFQRGQVKVECVGEVEDKVIQAWSEGNRHTIETVGLSEALKTEKTGVFVVPMVNAQFAPMPTSIASVVLVALFPAYTYKLTVIEKL